VIVLDTSVLAHAVGVQHPLKEPSERLVSAIGGGVVHATTTVEVIQEFAHIRSRRFPRKEAAAVARSYAQLLSPLLSVDETTLDQGLKLFRRHSRLGAFDAVLAAAALSHEADALVSADTAFAGIPQLRWAAPDSPELERLLGA
jgi:predicted nucleic acid-binding protein